MTPAPKRRWFRWSLRTLFVLVTLSCGWLAYELNWIRERRAFLAKQPTLRSTWPESLRRRADDSHWWKVASPSDRLAPGMLWLFGEKALESLHPIVAVDDIVAGNRKPEIARSHPEIMKATQLFPEAKITPMVCHERMGSNPTVFVVDEVEISD